jgi:hypothetical protein
MPRIVHIRFRNAAAAAADDVEVTVAHAGTYADHGRFDQGATAEFDVRDAALNGMMPSRLACSVTAVHFVDGSRWTAQL